jgi:hypothetical protein
MGPSLERNACRVMPPARSATSLPQGLCWLSPLAVSVTLSELPVKMPRCGPTGWRSTRNRFVRVTRVRTPRITHVPLVTHQG